MYIYLSLYIYIYVYIYIYDYTLNIFIHTRDKLHAQGHRLKSGCCYIFTGIHIFTCMCINVFIYSYVYDVYTHMSVTAQHFSAAAFKAMTGKSRRTTRRHCLNVHIFA